MSQPGINYPDIVLPGTIFDRFPFLLPNLVCTMLVFFGVVIGFLYLKETHPGKKYRRDVGIEARTWLLRKFQTRKQRNAARGQRASDLIELERILTPSPPTEESELSSTGDDSIGYPQKPTAATAFTPQVILHIVSYGILA